MIVFYELQGREYEEIGRVADGEIISGRDELKNVVHAPMLNDEEELLNVHDGPHVLTEKVEATEKWLPHEDDDGRRGWITSDASEVRYTDDPPGEVVKEFEEQADGWTDTDTLEKKWIPYQGPMGGEGWQNVETGEVRYTDNPPGSVQGVEDGDSDQSPQRWGSWDEQNETQTGDSETEESDTNDARDEITWENVQVGDEVTYYDKYGEMQQGEVTAVEQDEFGVVWVQQEEGAGKEPVERDDFAGGSGETLGDTIQPPDEGPTTAWMDDNLFIGQTVKLYNKQTDSIEYAEIEDLFIAGGEINGIEFEIEQSSGFSSKVTITSAGIDWGDEDANDVFEVRSAERWQTLTDEQKEEALTSQFHQNVMLTEMPHETRRKVSDQVTDEVIPSFRDDHVARETMKGLFRVANSVSRASCSGVDGFTIKVEERSPLNTLHHEFGHGIVSAYGYHYDRVGDRHEYSDEKWKRRPANTNHDWSDLQNRHGTLDFDFSEDSDWFAPEAYMLRKDTPQLREEFDVSNLSEEDKLEIESTSDEFGGGPIEVSRTRGEVEGKYSVVPVSSGPSQPPTLYIEPDGTVYDYETFDGGEFVEIGQVQGKYEQESPPGYDEWKESVEQQIAGIEYPDLFEREYQDPPEDQTDAELLDGLEDGDAVRFHVPTREPETQHLIFRGTQDRWNSPEDDSIDYLFEKPNGNEWHWSVDKETGELMTNHGSAITGFDNARSDDNDPADVEVDHPLEHWDGFDPNPETHNERIDNLVSAVNRAWYKQAKQFETSSDTFDNMSYYIGSGYSATNAHETMAQTHQVMQEGDELAVTNVIDRHPYLVASYVELFEVPKKTEERIQASKVAQNFGIEP